MPFLLIPQGVRGNSAEVWVAAVNENFDQAKTTLQYGSVVHNLSGWSSWSTGSGRYSISHLRAQLTNLKPRQSYTLRLLVGGAAVAEATVKTLPDKLPHAAGDALTVFLGSCFCRGEDEEGLVGKSFSLLPKRPDLKFLTGDQVYLDYPWWNFVIPRSHKWLEDRSFKTYLDAWTQEFDQIKGFRRLLSNGANFFVSDDHEFWNNAPDLGLNVATFTATEGQRTSWRNMALNLFQTFQSPKSRDTFSVEPLSFFVLDTRVNRRPGRAALISPDDLSAFANWIQNLSGPGVLAVGQPILAPEGSIKDWGLRDYPEFETLKRLLKASEHSIVVLTGDVHFPRIARCELRREMGTKLYEVISSPMQLIPGARGDWTEAPAVWGAAETEPNFWDEHKNHFMTLEFWAASARRVHMSVKYWPIDPTGSLPPRPVQLTHQPIELF
jgi:hypothetical protein